MSDNKFITWIQNYFKKKDFNGKIIRQSTTGFSGKDYFEKGFKYYKESAFIEGEGWQQKKKKLDQLAIECFDNALKKGYETSKLFALRADCLDYLGYHFNAIEDYNKALSMNPTEGVANGYWRRAMIKHTIFDFEGSRNDIITAITLSQNDNEDNRYWNEHAKSIGFNTSTELYKWDLEWIVERSLKHPPDLNKKEEVLKNIKRR